MMLKLKTTLMMFGFVCVVEMSHSAIAQDLDVSFTQDSDAVIVGENILSDPMDGVRQRMQMQGASVDISNMPSLFLTPSEQSLIQEARLGLTTRAPTAAELRQAEDGSVPMGPRELALGGIIYSSAGDWSVWLNGQQITPKRLPPEILDIKVRKNDIKLKWFDAYTNQIFPVKLKPHQRFNIDTRIFLPGESQQATVSQF